MKHLLTAILVLLSAGAARPDHPPAAARRAVLLPGLGDLHHPVSTRSRLAQQFFDQGLTLVYAFNHEEAILSFRRAAGLDPQLAMAHWGIALALGENINTEITPEREREAHAAIRQALALADRASEPEQAYIQALARRYTDAPSPDLKQLALAYNTAMGELVRRYPDDLDAAANAIPPAMLMRLNPAASVLKVPEALLAARIAQARDDRSAALAQLRQAVAAGDALSYDEPPDWYLPPRESLGGLLLLDGQNEAAEQVFRADLRRHVRSGRSLFGLWESLKRQRQDYAAGLVEREFTTAWRNADTRLRVEDL